MKNLLKLLFLSILTGSVISMGPKESELEREIQEVNNILYDWPNLPRILNREQRINEVRKLISKIYGSTNDEQIINIINDLLKLPKGAQQAPDNLTFKQVEEKIDLRSDRDIFILFEGAIEKLFYYEILLDIASGKTELNPELVNINSVNALPPQIGKETIFDGLYWLERFITYEKNKRPLKDAQQFIPIFDLLIDRIKELRTELQALRRTKSSRKLSAQKKATEKAQSEIAIDAKKILLDSYLFINSLSAKIKR